MKNISICNYWPQLSFYVLVVLVVTSKILVLQHYCFQFTGSDDMVLWQTAVDYSSGVFHEPYFYGQNYNFALEGLLSVPFILLGVPVYASLPLLSAFVGLFPFLLIAIVLFRKRQLFSSCVFLLIPLTLPIEYDIITSISRGFTTGLFFSAFLIFPLLEPNSKRSFLVLGLAVSLGYVFNPNSVIISIPVCIYMFLCNYKNVGFYILGLGAVFPALILQYFSQRFYHTHPNYLVHSSWPFLYDFGAMLEGISDPVKYFQYLTPIYWSGSWIVVLIILLLGALLVKKNWKKGAAILFTVLFIMVVLGVYKVNDDIGVIFLSSTRMFLAVPLLLGLSVFWLLENFELKKIWFLTIIGVGGIVLLAKFFSYPSVIEEHTTETNYGPIAIKNLDELINECDDLEQLVAKHNVDLVVFLPGDNYNVPSLEFYNYGCPIIGGNTFSTVMNVYERRTWVFEEERRGARNTLMLFNQNVDRIEEYQKSLDCKVVSRTPDILLIQNNTKTLQELSDLFGFPLKRNSY